MAHSCEDNAKIDLPDTGTPVELDRIYKSLSDLTQALGPNGANKNGSLDTLLTAGTKALRGNGQLGNETLINLSEAVQTFGDNSGPLFDSVENMSQLTDTLAANDRVVDGFMSDLTSVSSQLAADRGNLAKALDALARAVGTVRTFVRDNKDDGGDRRAAADPAHRRAGPPPEGPEHAGQDRCAGPGQPHHRLRQQDQHPGCSPAVHAQRRQPRQHDLRHHAQLREVPAKAGRGQQRACELLRTIVAPFSDQIGADPSQNQSQPAQLKLGGTTPPKDLDGLLGALKEGNAS